MPGIHRSVGQNFREYVETLPWYKKIGYFFYCFGYIIIIAIVILGAAGWTVYEKRTSIVPDVNVICIGCVDPLVARRSEAQDGLSAYVDDYDKDGYALVYCRLLSLDYDVSYYEPSIFHENQKWMMMELTVGENTLFLLQRELYESIIEFDSTLFVDISDIAGDLSEDGHSVDLKKLKAAELPGLADLEYEWVFALRVNADRLLPTAQTAQDNRYDCAVRMFARLCSEPK